MRRNGLLAALVSALATAFAHHPFMDGFDSNIPVAITGIVAKKNGNPHVYAYVDAKDPRGKMVSQAQPSELVDRINWKYRAQRASTVIFRPRNRSDR